MSCPHALTAALALALVLPAANASQERTGQERTGQERANQDRAGEAPAAVAMRLLDRMDAHDYAAAEAMFDARMAAAVPQETLAKVWDSLPPAGTRGAPTVVARANGVGQVTLPLTRNGVELVAKIAIDTDGKVVGFVVQPGAVTPAAAPAVPADAPYTERETHVGAGAASLRAILALPRGTGPFPAVVLVHGSGPHDRDESIGPNRPFLDIARGLAAEGIAVLRYDKRTRVQPQTFAGDKADVDHETTDDAVLAVEALRQVRVVDPERIYVLGHSQGGLLAPRIAARSGHVAGLVLFAAPARPLLDIVVEQNRRLAVLDDGHTSPEESARIAGIQAQAKAVRDPATPADATSLMNMPVRYWRSIDAVDPVAEAQPLGLPMLLLQGARDIQIVDADWQRWKSAFHADPKATFKLYPALNHLGIAGEGEGSLAEYARPGHVDAHLIADVAAWIKDRAAH